MVIRTSCNLHTSLLHSAHLHAATVYYFAEWSCSATVHCCCCYSYNLLLLFTRSNCTWWIWSAHPIVCQHISILSAHHVVCPHIMYFNMLFRKWTCYLLFRSMFIQMMLLLLLLFSTWSCSHVVLNEHVAVAVQNLTNPQLHASYSIDNDIAVIIIFQSNWISTWDLIINIIFIFFCFSNL